MATKNERLLAAREKAAADRRIAERRRRRNRLLIVIGSVLAVLIIAGGIVGITVAASNAAQGDTVGRTTAAPWGRPSDIDAQVTAAGLSMLTTEGTALHIHQHLTVTVDGKAVPVPAEIGIDDSDQLSSIHTHDTSGVIHVESPTVRTFTLGQVFTEWDVHLAKGSIGGYTTGKNGAKVTVYVDQKLYTGDPTKVVLASHEDIDIFVTHDGSVPAAPKAYVWTNGL